MTKTECAAKLRELIQQYNDELNQAAPNKNLLDSIEEQAKEVQGQAKSARKVEIYDQLDKAANPMLEAARMGEFDYEGFRIDKETGEMEPMVRVAVIRAADYTTHLLKLSNSKVTGARFPKNGVFTHGHAWEYMCEKLGLLLAYRAQKELGGSPEVLAELLKTYPIREAAQKEKAGATPTSNTQLLKLLQPIIDALVWEDDGKGGNAVKANGKDVAFLVNCFTSHGKGIGSIKVLKGQKVADYIFEAVHMIVTGKPYQLQFKPRKDATAEAQVTARKPVKSASADEKSADAPVILTSAEESANDTSAA